MKYQYRYQQAWSIATAELVRRLMAITYGHPKMFIQVEPHLSNDLMPLSMVGGTQAMLSDLFLLQLLSEGGSLFLYALMQLHAQHMISLT